MTLILSLSTPGFVQKQPGGDGVQFCRKLANGRKVTGEIRQLVNIRSLPFECSAVLLKRFTEYILIYENETNCKEEERKIWY